MSVRVALVRRIPTWVLAGALVVVAVQAAVADTGPGSIVVDSVTEVPPGYGGTISDASYHMVLRPDGSRVQGGRCYLGGGKYGWRFVRYLASGALDTSFGAAGVVNHFGLGVNTLSGVAVDGDGRVYATGTATLPSGGGGAVLVRLLENGGLDTTFGTSGDGVVGLPMTPNQLAVDASGRPVVAGTWYKKVKKASVGYLRLTRHLSTGAVDTSFGTNGVADDNRAAASATRGFASRLAIQADGRIVLGHDTPATTWALSRYLANGSVDTSFGVGGSAVGAEGEYTKGLAIDGQGRIVVQGNRTASGGQDGLVRRYTTSGSLDGSFGTGGTAVIESSTVTVGTAGPAFQSDGRILVAVVHMPDTGQTDEHATVVRLDADGSLDEGFGTGGIGETFQFGDQTRMTGLAVTGAGAIVATGFAWEITGTGNLNRWFTLQYTP